MIGAQVHHRDLTARVTAWSSRLALCSGGSSGENSSGPNGEENPGHSSSVSRVRIPTTEKSKGSSAMLISRGLAGPKSRRNSSGSKGKRVNIPVPSCSESRRLGAARAGFSPGRTVQVRGSRNGRKRTNGGIGKLESIWGPWKDEHDVRTKIRHRCSGSESLGLSGTTDVREFGKLVP